MATFRLRVLSGTAAGTEYPLNAAEMTLGRSPDNYICIEDGNASRVHAKIQVIGGQAVLVDNRSRNGVYVNNNRVQQHTLRHGDRIGIGSTILEFHQLDAQPAAGPARQPQRQRQPQQQPQRQPRTTGAARQPGRPITPQKNAGGGNNRLVLYGVAGLGLVAILGMVGYNMLFGGGGGGGGNATATPITRVTLEPLPDITSKEGTNFKKNQLQARLYVDHGDSKRISDDLLGAYILYGKAVKTDPSCEVCKSRMDQTRQLILKRVDDYERGGQLAYDSGRYDEAAARWTRAIELLGNFSPERSKALKRNVEEAEQKAEEFLP